MSSNNGPSTSAEVAASISPPAEAPRPKKNNAASQSLDEDQIAKAQQLNHVPQGEEYKKMISGMLYNALEPELMAARHRARLLQYEYNNMFPADSTMMSLAADRNKLLSEKLIGKMGKDVYIEPPLHVDYGCNISLGDGFYANYNCIFLDCALITIGARTLFGPGVQVITATHETSVSSRRTMEEFAKPVTIGADCWIGANAIILPGVTIGDGCTIGAGSVVPKDIPPYSIAVGNPCRIIRKAEE